MNEVVEKTIEENWVNISYRLNKEKLDDVLLKVIEDVRKLNSMHSIGLIRNHLYIGIRKEGIEIFKIEKIDGYAGEMVRTKDLVGLIGDGEHISMVPGFTYFTTFKPILSQYPGPNLVGLLREFIT